MPISRLVQRLSRPAPTSVPHGERVYSIGDIHGRLDLVEELIAAVDADDAARGPANTTLVFLGDLIDRGPDSRGVVERLRQLSLERPQTRFIGGNHEQVFLRAVGGDAKATRFLVRIGGRPTILSYGIGETEYEEMEYSALTERLAELVPAEHVAFLSSFEQWVEVGDYLFVHAGLRPGVPIEQQSPEDLRWIRDEFLNCRSSFGRLVVHGHTVTEDVEIRSNRIGIDTGAYQSGRLTALGLEGSDRWFLST